MPSQYDENRITDIHQDDIIEFRKRMAPLLKKYPCYDTNFALLRWLKGCKFDQEMAEQKMKWSLNAMNAIGVFEKDLSSIEKIEEILEAIIPLNEYFPNGILGYDKNGYLLLIYNIGKTHPRSLISAERMSRFYINAIHGYEGMQCLIRSEEAKRGCKLGTVIIADLNDFKYDVVFHLPAVKIYITGARILQDMFPDMTVKFYIVNAPVTAQYLVRMVVAGIAKETMNMIEFLGSNYKEILIERHGAKFLPKKYGGVLDDYIFRRGGEVPKHIVEMNKKHIPEKKLKKIIVNARNEEVVSINVEKPNSKLSWYFICSSGDIDFCVLFEGNEVWPCFRICTEFRAEYNEIMCKEAGIYQLLFSNKHGYMRSKRIQYHVDIVEPLA
ncbi:unnamed protein product [Onchocerca ochengi]|uniref:CRAL-TRIO domain-containing protein n=1 Tax=Onchocerca ochengi TaxID=42157 RepID=A0A182EGD1_ONCOC|nr:unnamed protein product [Onchocerca ochengi]